MPRHMGPPGPKMGGGGGGGGGGGTHMPACDTGFTFLKKSIRSPRASSESTLKILIPILDITEFILIHASELSRTSTCKWLMEFTIIYVYRRSHLHLGVIYASVTGRITRVIN